MRVKDDSGKMAGAHAQGSVVLQIRCEASDGLSDKHLGSVGGRFRQCSKVLSSQGHDVQGEDTVWVKHAVPS